MKTKFAQIFTVLITIFLSLIPSQVFAEKEPVLSEEESLLVKVGHDFALNPIQVSSEGARIPADYAPPFSPTPRGGPASLWNIFAEEGVSSSTFTQPKIIDLDLDGRKEIISSLLSADISANCASVISQGIYVWDEFGNLKPGFPVLLQNLVSPLLCGYLSIVGVGDVSGDSKLEIVIATGREYLNSSGNYVGGVYIISDSGQILSHIQSESGFSGVDNQHVVLANLDSDTKLEIIAKDIASIANSDHPVPGITLYAWKGNGISLPGWPITLPGRTNLGEPAFVELNSGQKLVIINIHPTYFGYQTGIMALRPDGGIQWFTDMPWPWTPVIGDVDADGQPEVVVQTTDYSSNGEISIYILNAANGQIKYSWQNPLAWSNDYNISLGDLDKNGTLEIVSHDDRTVYARNYLGHLLPGFPSTISDGYNNLTALGIADLDGDGFSDIVGLSLYDYRTTEIGGHAYSLFAFNRLGQSLPGFPFPLINTVSLASTLYTFAERYMPTYADFDNNGVADIVTSKGWGQIEAITLNAPHKPAFFSQYGVNEKNTKFVRRKIPALSIRP